jgi:hypothetical protein
VLRKKEMEPRWRGLGSGPKGEEERVTGNYIVVHPVWDHEEWTRLARDAEGGIFVAQGFVVRENTRGGYVTDPLEVEGALRVVAEHERWTLADVGGPIVSCTKPLTVDYLGTQMEGGWWIVVPIDYLEDANHPALEFHAEYEGREIVFWAFEAHVKRFGGPKLPEFDHKIEFALRGKDLYVHDDYPDVRRHHVGSKDGGR